MKATLLKWWEMSWPARTKLKAWMRQSASFNGVDPVTFSDPSIRIAQASNEQGEPLVFCPVQTCFLLDGYAVGPEVTPEEAHRAGDLIDSMLEREAQRAGVSKLLICIPEGCPNLPEGEWKTVRVYERLIPSAVNTHLIDASATAQASHFIN